MTWRPWSPGSNDEPIQSPTRSGSYIPDFGLCGFGASSSSLRSGLASLRVRDRVGTLRRYTVFIGLQWAQEAAVPAPGKFRDVVADSHLPGTLNRNRFSFPHSLSRAHWLVRRNLGVALRARHGERNPRFSCDARVSPAINCAGW